MTIDWWLPLKITFFSCLWLFACHIVNRNEIITIETPDDHSPARAVLYLKAGSPLPPGAYFQTRQNSESLCRSVPSLGGDAVAILRTNMWELTFPDTQVGVYIDGPAHSCNISMPGSITIMSGKTGLYLRENLSTP